MTEDAAALVLNLMGLCTFDESTHTTRIRSDGWDALGAEFMIDEFVELKMSSLLKRETWYIRLGKVTFEHRTPVGIWSQFKKNNGSVHLPKAIGNRRTTAFVTTELVTILKSSDMFHKVFQTRYFREDLSATEIGRIGTGLQSYFLNPVEDDGTNVENNNQAQESTIAVPIMSVTSNLPPTVEIDQEKIQVWSVVFHSEPNDVTEELLCELQDDLKLTMLEWKRMGISFTPKFHIMLDHGAKQMKRVHGFSKMKEDLIERSHQSRFRDEMRLARLRKKEMIKQCQAKFENTRKLAPVQEIMKDVSEKSKRAIKREKPLAMEREDAKRIKRTEKRVEATTSAKSQDFTVQVQKPRETIKKGLKAIIRAARAQEESKEESKEEAKEESKEE